jgi:hypothetical protein
MVSMPRRTKRTRSALLAKVMSSALLLAAIALPAPGAALADDGNLACQLIPVGHVKHVFRLPHAVELEHPHGGTDETDGAFNSTCSLITYKKKELPGVNPFGRGPAYRVRKGFADLVVTTTVQDEGVGGENWDPEEIRTQELTADETLMDAWGGRSVTFPLFGQTERHGIEWATLPDNARGWWRDGDDGFISLSVASHGGPAGQYLADIAAAIVPQFKP